MLIYVFSLGNSIQSVKIIVSNDVINECAESECEILFL